VSAKASWRPHSESQKATALPLLGFYFLILSHCCSLVLLPPPVPLPAQHSHTPLTFPLWLLSFQSLDTKGNRKDSYLWTADFKDYLRSKSHVSLVRLVESSERGREWCDRMCQVHRHWSFLGEEWVSWAKLVWEVESDFR
jgi:hypothetical protein